MINDHPFLQDSDGVLRRVSSAGGLVTAVAPVVSQSKGLWVGWPGHGLTKGQHIPEPEMGDESPTAGLASKHVRHRHTYHYSTTFKKG